jgi:two-component system sensor histidine kinase PfeS
VGWGIVLNRRSIIKLSLFTKLYLLLAVSGIFLIWAVIIVSDYTEANFSTISVDHQQQLQEYAMQASRIINGDDNSIRISDWVDKVSESENTWLAIIRSEFTWLAGSYNEDVLYGERNLTAGRDIHYPIHLYYSHNPVMKLNIPSTEYTLLIQLPQSMRPGVYWNYFDNLIKIGLPIVFVTLLSFLIYRHIIFPLKSLERATHSISDGDFDIELADDFVRRDDEMGELARSFRAMAKKINLLVERQRQLIQDISHELRTPITRIKLMLNNELSQPTLDRVEQEVNGMQALLEDTLMLSWLNNEETQLVKESVDLVLLIDAICEDASFEFSRNDIVITAPETCLIHESNHRAVGQALENIIRNSMKYTPAGTPINIELHKDNAVSPPNIVIHISDNGEGIDENYLEEIFEPFFRVNPARDHALEEHCLEGNVAGGYGLGLALSKRQVEAVGGSIYAKNNIPQGLLFIITLPVGNCLANNSSSDLS